jgi:signal transduction histidine kinase
VARSSSASARSFACGKLGAWRSAVNSPSADRSPASAGSARPSIDERSYRSFQERAFSAARAGAAELALRWEAQIKSVALMDGARMGEATDAGLARRLTEALLGSSASDDSEGEEAIAAGLEFGTNAFAHGSSLHHTMKALDLLVAMSLYAVEHSIDDVQAAEASAAQGVRVARHLQRRGTLLSLSATRGYMQAYTEALRERFRHLRHDLRNPLGTIKSVLALMNDESVPPDARTDPRFQTMAKRNARSLEDLIADRLSDAAALLPIVADQEVSLRSVACAVRRELRSEFEQRGVTMLVGTTAPYGRVDAPGLELLLRGVLQAMLQSCVDGDQLQLEFSGPIDGRGTVSVSCESGREPIRDASALERLSALSHRIGASISAVRHQVLVSVPMQAPIDDESSSLDAERSVSRGSVALGDRDARDDVRSARERKH